MIKFLLVAILLPHLSFSQVGKAGGRLKIVGNDLMIDSSGTWVKVARESQTNGHTFQNLPGVPSTFPPSAHNHPASETNSGTFSDARIAASNVTQHQAALAIARTQVTGYQGYTINVQALTSSPADGQTVYFGTLPKAPVTAAATSKIYIRKAGTLKIAEIYCYSGTAGTNESWSVNIRVNNTTDHLIATVGTAVSERVFSKTDLSITLNAGDYIEIKSVQPTWVTNPLTCIWGGYIYIE